VKFSDAASLHSVNPIEFIQPSPKKYFGMNIGTMNAIRIFSGMKYLKKHTTLQVKIYLDPVVRYFGSTKNY